MEQAENFDTIGLHAVRQDVVEPAEHRAAAASVGRLAHLWILAYGYC